jgi:cytochrome c oxidase subunit 2
MLTKLGLIPEQASTLAGRVDALYFFLIGVTVFFSVLIAVLVLGFAVRYRRSRQAKAVQIHGNLALELLWTGIPFAIAMMIFVWSARST